MRRVFTLLINTLFPPHDDVVHAQRVTEQRIGRIVSVRRMPNGIYTALPYSNPSVRALIKANKFYQDRHAAQLLASVLYDLLIYIEDEFALEPLVTHAFLIPIPSSSAKKRERGYNQIEHIIEQLPKETIESFIYMPRALARHDRPSQARVPREARRDNIRGAFFVSPEQQGALKGEAVFLIDDVSESGATMADATRALKEAGALTVIGIALAK